MTATPRARLLLAAVLAAVLIVVLAWMRAAADPPVEVVGDSPSREAWKTIEYDGVRVDVPSAWERLDMGDCEFQLKRWARPDSPPCVFEEGIAFYDSATFDPAHGPGVVREIGNRTPTWGGYTYVGEVAVYASYGDRALVQDLLASAREAG
ncbi:hypothetical protein [Nocardioides acrostichi]|uniref:Uncharacterized protein n=1 Tax=Nocardioides acrostichi TaxID=2784339 RepID=A0A930V2J8_9ACTN|nr:hypothetical protein [Nocardioides acrostichi]MBF4162839.1 hypothetical protein [Nocardioides acrostichi]